VNAKMCIYVGQEQWPGYLRHTSTSAESKSVKASTLLFFLMDSATRIEIMVEIKIKCRDFDTYLQLHAQVRLIFPKLTVSFGTRKAEVLNSLIINTTAKANDTTDILQTFR